jgi:hypothetical protein
MGVALGRVERGQQDQSRTPQQRLPQLSHVMHAHRPATFEGDWEVTKLGEVAKAPMLTRA